MSNVATPGRPRGSGWYQIRLQGHLDQRWSAWFDGLTLTTDADGSTTLRGPVADQAALHGLLQRLRDLGMPLVSVTPADPDPPTERHPADPPDQNTGDQS